MKKANRKNQVKKEYYLVNAKDHILGRLATKIANVLYGKNKKNFMPNLDMGDYVVIINAKDIKVTGRKIDKKIYNRHTGYPGGLKSETLKEVLEKKPEEVIRRAVKGMLPKNKLAKEALKRLKIYKDENHKDSKESLKELKF